MQRENTRLLFFFIASFFFILPPLFLQSSNFSFSEISFPTMQASFAFFAIILYFVFFQTQNKRKSALAFHINVGFTLLTFGALCILATIINLISIFLKKTNEINFSSPKNFSSILFLLLLFAFASWFEEIMYRAFLPFAVNNLLKIFFNKINFTNHLQNEKIIFFISEFFALFSFALSHKYLGFFSVVNALCAGIILRLCFLKTKTPFTNFFAHFFYNVFFLFLKIAF